MRRVKVIINYSDLSVLELIELCRKSVLKMSSNGGTFPNPDVSYNDINNGANELERLYHEAQGGDKQKISETNQKVKTVLEMVRKQAMYVERIADGDETIILMSGFDMSKQPVVPVKAEFVATNGEHSGTMDLQRKAVQGAKSWVWQYSVDNAEWIQAGISTQASFTVKGLTPVTKCWFRSAYVTTEGQSDWCNPICEIVK